MAAISVSSFPPSTSLSFVKRNLRPILLSVPNVNVSTCLSMRITDSDRLVSSCQCSVSGSHGGFFGRGKQQLKQKNRFCRTKSMVLSEEGSEFGRKGSNRALEDANKVISMEALDSSSSSPPPPYSSSTSSSPSPSSVSTSFNFELGLAAGGGSTSLTSSASSSISFQPKYLWFAKSKEEEDKFLDRGINGAIVGFAVAAAVAKIFTVDHDYWAGWTFFEIVRNAPHHNWLAYEAMLETNPVFAKMIISGVVYTIGDWSAQCYEGRGFLEFDRTRMFRSGLVGFCLHGSLSHYYYHFCEWLFPYEQWWVVPLKVAFDQTIWSGIWNSIYYVTLGMLRLDNPVTIFKELKATFFPLLTAGWKLWPFAHIVTYGVMPVEQRLLWVDMVELVWVTILSMISNEKAEERKTDGGVEVLAVSETRCLEGAEKLLTEGEEAAMDSILWPANMEGQEYIIEDGEGVRRLERSNPKM